MQATRSQRAALRKDAGKPRPADEAAKATTGAAQSSQQPILATAEVTKTYRDRSSRSRGELVVAADRVSVAVHRLRSVGIAGESGSGKTTIMRLLLRLEQPSSGYVAFNGVPLNDLDRTATTTYHRTVQAVFQNPVASLDPHYRLWNTLTEPATLINRKLSREQRIEMAGKLLAEVGLPSSYALRRPRQISGGEAQRIAIARALSCDPEVVLLDEPVTSLDVSIRGRVLSLLAERGESRGITYVVISHDVTALSWLTSYMYVMYRGIVVEQGPTDSLLSTPLHPYTELLVRAGLGGERPQAAPPTAAGRQRATVAPAAAGHGCPFRTRCPIAIDRCAQMPVLTPSADQTQAVRCHVRADKLEKSS
jgi:oligopeptide/dipeptide ABC transporter ATP-binding protein